MFAKLTFRLAVPSTDPNSRNLSSERADRWMHEWLKLHEACRSGETTMWMLIIHPWKIVYENISSTRLCFSSVDNILYLSSWTKSWSTSDFQKLLLVQVGFMVSWWGQTPLGDTPHFSSHPSLSAAFFQYWTGVPGVSCNCTWANNTNHLLVIKFSPW